jgi:hypothetical protein
MIDEVLGDCADKDWTERTGRKGGRGRTGGRGRKGRKGRMGRIARMGG